MEKIAEIIKSKKVKVCLEFNYEKFKNKFNIKYGTINKFDIRSIYININSWCKVLNKKDDDLENNDYNIIIRKLNKEIRQTISQSIRNKSFSRDKLIVSLTLRNSGLKMFKKTFCNLEINLYNRIANSEIVLTDSLKKEIENIINEVIRNILNKNKYFEFYLKKR